MSYHLLVAKASQYTFKLLEKGYLFINALMTGFWLGVMGTKSLDAADELYYNSSLRYNGEDHNTSGLFQWEKKLIEKYFTKSNELLLIAAGGGREVLALIDMGYKVDSYECNSQLVAAGNKLLKSRGLQQQIWVIQIGRAHV